MVLKLWPMIELPTRLLLQVVSSTTATAYNPKVESTRHLTLETKIQTAALPPSITLAHSTDQGSPILGWTITVRMDISRWWLTVRCENLDIWDKDWLRITTLRWDKSTQASTKKSRTRIIRRYAVSLLMNGSESKGTTWTTWAIQADIATNTRRMAHRIQHVHH